MHQGAGRIVSVHGTAWYGMGRCNMVQYLAVYSSILQWAFAVEGCTAYLCTSGTSQAGWFVQMVHTS